MEESFVCCYDDDDGDETKFPASLFYGVLTTGTPTCLKGLSKQCLVADL